MEKDSKMKFLILFLATFCFSEQFDCLPKHTVKELVVQHFAYTLCFSDSNHISKWVVYTMNADKLKDVCERKNNFRPDSLVKNSARPSDYKGLVGQKYDMGHLAPADDMGWSVVAMSQSFYMTNMTPQVPGFNRGIWKKLEWCLNMD